MSSHEGGCHCGAVRFAVETTDKPEEAPRTALCHCADCRRCAGAPVMGWTAVASSTFRVLQGSPAVYQSSELAERSFCGRCGTGLFYINETVLPGLVDIQTATFDDPDAFPAMAHIQAAEEIGWMKTAHELPKFERFPEF
ncbi:GFA family protein [Blastomonas sp. AAP53]|uniref:GFA family protein n=1 Tax=Blastomonas sp. AAP53 TaxID=1248760 RepID=UPI0002FD818E|nr:GFA family protein [Blastomonas sp. AAP53]